jgi:hypothetical protein
LRRSLRSQIVAQLDVILKALRIPTDGDKHAKIEAFKDKIELKSV